MSYLILGYNRTGLAVEKWCIQNSIKYYIYDDKFDVSENLRFSESDWSDIQRIVVSPGFRTLYNKHRIITEALKRGVEIISDLDLFYENRKNPKSKIIGITGTNGKSTTAALLNHILSSSGYNSELCGNFGQSPLLNLLADFYVVEVSSAQLEISKKIRFDVSVIINITPDHFDYHGNMENYINAKKKICDFSKLTFAPVEILDLFKEKSLNHLELFDPFSLFDKFKNNIKLIGIHNLINTAFAFKICENLKINKEKILSGISSFKGLEHRMEIVETSAKSSTLFINDSKSTTPDSTFTALRALHKYQIYLIVGGYKKTKTIKFRKEDFMNVRFVFCIGSSQDYFYKKFKDLGIQVKKSNTLKNAIQDFFDSNSDKKESVLILSPMCASYDQYKNFEERGRDFKISINQFISK